MTETFVQVVLPSGNRAVYEVTPQHLCHQTGLPRRESIRMHCRQVAHKLGDAWHAPGGWTEIHDSKLAKLLDSCTLIQD